MSVDIQKIKDQVLQYSDQLERVKAEVRKALIGQDLMLSRLLIALLTGGHVLLEGVPGLAKTTAIKALAAAIHCKLNRIQFTPDLLPADLMGTLIYGCGVMGVGSMGVGSHGCGVWVWGRSGCGVGLTSSVAISRPHQSRTPSVSS